MGADDGYFPRELSVARRVMEERVVALYYGQRASLVGALEALAFVGTTLHTYSGRTSRPSTRPARPTRRSTRG